MPMPHHAGVASFKEGRKGYESARPYQATCQELQVSLAHVRETSCALQGIKLTPNKYIPGTIHVFLATDEALVTKCM